MHSSGALLLTLLTVCIAASGDASAAPDVQEMSLLMPAVAPKLEDTYLCTAMQLDTERYIREFNPQHAGGHAHHILVTTCKEPGSRDKVWNCGEMSTKEEGSLDKSEWKVAPQCAEDTRIIYAYAMEAPPLKLPQGVTFGVGPKLGVTWLVVQVHYKNVKDFTANPALTDSSGVKFAYQTVPSPKLGGVHLSVSDGVIPAHSVTYLETSCSYSGEAALHPFAFRTHTHGLGRVVSGYRVRDGDWSLIGSGNPQLPQMFYPVNGTGAIRPGDQIAAKCVMENTQDHDIAIGATQKDEMCNFYMMYWVLAPDMGKDGEHICYFDSGLWNLAPEEASELSSTVPGTQRMFQEMGRRVEQMNKQMKQLMRLFEDEENPEVEF